MQSRALTKAQAIRVRLGGSANMLAAFLPKPKGMHDRTYTRLFWEAHKLDATYFALITSEIDRQNAFLSR